MDQEKIKKVRFKRDDLPPLTVGEDGYVFRYRVVSEDKNRSSHWSPIETIKPEYTYSYGTISGGKQGTIVTVAWDAVVVSKDDNFIRNAHEYDIWVRWDRSDSGDWLYKERIDGTSISIVIPSTYTIGGVVQGSQPNKLAVEIYMKGNPITRGDGIPGDPGVLILKSYQLLDLTV